MRICLALAMAMLPLALGAERQQLAPDVLPPLGTTQLMKSLADAAAHAQHPWRDTPPLNPDVTLLLPSDIPLQLSEPELRGAALRSLQNLVERHLENAASVVTDVRFGNPWPVICDYAKQTQVELIVVSTHGRTGLGHAIIGSTAERIVQHSPCPVLTVKAHERGFLKE